MADDGVPQVTIREVTKTEVSVDVGGTVTHLRQIIPDAGDYRVDPPKVLEAGRTYTVTLLEEDGRAMLRLPWGDGPKITEHSDKQIRGGGTGGDEGSTNET